MLVPADDPSKIEVPYALGSERPSQEEILNCFKPHEQKIIRDRLLELSGLTNFVGNNFTMRIFLGPPGEDSCWNPNTTDVYIDPLVLLNKPLEVRRFIFCHEGTHCLLSCPTLIPKEIYKKRGFPLFYNYLEDPRINNFQSQGDRDYRKGQSIFYSEMLKEVNPYADYLEACDFNAPPRYLLASSELMKIWFQLREYDEFEIDETLPSEVIDAVKEALPGAKRYWKVYPSRDESDSRDRVIEYAKAAHHVLITEVWPHIEKLIEKDLEDAGIVPNSMKNTEGEEVISKFKQLDELFDNWKDEAPNEEDMQFAFIPDFSGELDSQSELDGNPKGEKVVNSKPKPKPKSQSQGASSYPKVVKPDLDECMFFRPEEFDDIYNMPDITGNNLENYLDNFAKVNSIVDPVYRELSAHYRERAKIGRRRGREQGVEIDFED